MKYISPPVDGNIDSPTAFYGDVSSGYAILKQTNSSG